MKLINYLEAIERDLSSIKKDEIKEYVWIVFDLETNGLIGSQGLKLTTGEKYYDQEQKRNRNIYSDKDLEVAEIAAFAYDPKTKKKFVFHEFIKANLKDEIKKLISWNDMKESKAKEHNRVFKKLDKYLGLIKNRKKIIIAHNGKAYDFKIMKLIGEKFDLINIKNTFDYSKKDDENNILIDTKETGKIRKKLSNLPWPTGINPETGKDFNKNKQDDLLEMIGIKNLQAHTAVEDVAALSKYLIKILRELAKHEKI